MENKYSPKYVANGPAGRTCADCMHFKRGVDFYKGTCFGKEVMMTGSCNLFSKKL